MTVTERLKNLDKIESMINESGFSVDEAGDAIEAINYQMHSIIYSATIFGLITVDEADTLRYLYID